MNVFGYGSNGLGRRGLPSSGESDTCSDVNFREDLRNESGKPIVGFLL
jgi:hypothetical protein